ncbi:NADP-dependent oxidoreductase domain-containing protein [Gymnopilus junonius]|uniref:NADP-dependent oxidoreductase domain-containing protein n=1 Tax=Gymnopilus junonius TaxID=109634 RepID=A0A9P5TG31_GYMJU|nr:NADP-dependent oxidoreductase domain-containing protein [Gymnopilus junonius]
MQNYTITNNLTPFISMQNHHCLLYARKKGRCCLHSNISALGVSSGRLSHGASSPVLLVPKRIAHYRAVAQYLKAPGTPEVMNRVEEVAMKMGISMAQVSIAWLLSKDGVTAPIVSRTSLRNLEDIIAGVHVKLSDEDIRYLEEPYYTVGHI